MGVNRRIGGDSRALDFDPSLGDLIDSLPSFDVGVETTIRGDAGVGGGREEKAKETCDESEDEGEEEEEEDGGG